MNTIDRITALADARMLAYAERNPVGAGDMQTTPFDFLTADERDELHRAKLALPTQGEEVQRARERIRARIDARKNKSP